MGDDLNVSNSFSVKRDFGISTEKQNKVAQADAMDTLQKMLTGKYNEDGVVTADEEQQIADEMQKYEAQFKKGTGEVGLGKIIFGERFRNMATERINNILDSGVTDKKSGKYVKNLNDEIDDNLKQSGYKGGYTNVNFGAKMGQNINVLDRLPEEQRNNLKPSLNQADTDKKLKSLGFEPDKRNYDAKTGAYEGSYMNEYGQTVRNFVKILENPETKQQYLVMTDIIQGDTENDFSVSTRALGIQRTAEGLTLTENIQASPSSVDGKQGLSGKDATNGVDNEKAKEYLNKTLESAEFKNDKNRTKQLSQDQIKTFVENGWSLADINTNINSSLRYIDGNSINQLKDAIEANTTGTSAAGEITHADGTPLTPEEKAAAEAEKKAAGGSKDGGKKEGFEQVPKHTPTIDPTTGKIALEAENN